MINDISADRDHFHFQAISVSLRAGDTQKFAKFKNQNFVWLVCRASGDAEYQVILVVNEDDRLAWLHLAITNW